ncbi:hypothetical protein ACQKPX_05050 [Photobacterium sp. DNB23_23_1]|uniref:Uncharacterized protein n=1 Tax=Photobacterium pectinilyticum TaxID=2906793 RepID=A0ABT1N8M6_9GAMM|nr:hypothetical protein [Photobacterium sp. ZSDE20]MCQ1061115.1 hypothetical protein [Photobacterium sp. ZSDE20]MDD1829282.1 hypothetical protein [Photobacterium sp. ZSDE20]
MKLLNCNILIDGDRFFTFSDVEETLEFLDLRLEKQEVISAKLEIIADKGQRVFWFNSKEALLDSLMSC